MKGRIRSGAYMLLLVATIGGMYQESRAAKAPACPNVAEEDHLLVMRSSPSDGYAPASVACPAPSPDQPGGSSGLLRNAGQPPQLSSQEQEYLARHQNATQASWSTWLSAKPPGADMESVLPGGVANWTGQAADLPRVGLAISGGGYRSMLFGSGVIQAFDARNETAMQRGTGGLLPLPNWLTGLSGGSWAVGSAWLNDWPQSQALLTDVWNLSTNLVRPQQNRVSFYNSIAQDVRAKSDAGFNVTITDYWGRSLSYHLLNASFTNHGAAATWSDIVNTSAWGRNEFPYPIVIANQRQPSEIGIQLNDSVVEFSPDEFGSWNPSIQAFFPMRLLGTNVSDGNSNGSCIEGFDNAGWVMGTSSSLFSSAYVALVEKDNQNLLSSAVTTLAAALSNRSVDVSLVPNPYKDATIVETASNSTNSTAQLSQLALADSGGFINLPLEPLVQPVRAVDAILAADASADTDTLWPNGTALWYSQLRYSDAAYSSISFPRVPKMTTFINRGLNTRPVFFGCNASDAVEGRSPANMPVIVYLPNYPWRSLSNTSSFQFEYSLDQAQTVLDAGFETATFGGGSLGGDLANTTWSTCLACAMLQRSFERRNATRPSTCQRCMERFCWDGISNDSAPATPYSPPVGVPVFLASNGTEQTGPSPSGTGVPASNRAVQGQSAGPALLGAVSTTLAVVILTTTGLATLG